MKILILGLNYLPEPVGIGPYTAGMAQFLAGRNHRVTVVCAKPYYPGWRIDPAYAGGGVRHSDEQGVRVVRLPIYVPRTPTGLRRLIHHASFAARAQVTMLFEARRLRPDVVITIAPSLVSTIAARSTAWLFGAKLWVHVQDFEVDAAFATGLLAREGLIARFARAFEQWMLHAGRVSTISPQMRERLVRHGIADECAIEFRNWASVDIPAVPAGDLIARSERADEGRHIALYAGNIANKQGIGVIVEAARLLAGRRDLLFVISGNGSYREQLVAQAKGLNNIRFQDVQPMERLPELLGSATVHLLPQIAGAADLVLPSKLTNMLASGRPVVATAYPGTGLAHEVDGCGLVTEPGDAIAFAAAIERLIDDPASRETFGTRARQRARERWSREAVLGQFEHQLTAYVGERSPNEQAREGKAP